jgi:hypothetical protein
MNDFVNYRRQTRQPDDRQQLQTVLLKVLCFCNGVGINCDVLQNEASQPRKWLRNLDRLVCDRANDRDGGDGQRWRCRTGPFLLLQRFAIEDSRFGL